jgi:hypothetical protein
MGRENPVFPASPQAANACVTSGLLVNSVLRASVLPPLRASIAVMRLARSNAQPSSRLVRAALVMRGVSTDPRCPQAAGACGRIASGNISFLKKKTMTSSAAPKGKTQRKKGGTDIKV